jgi:hypothetical protein
MYTRFSIAAIVGAVLVVVPMATMAATQPVTTSPQTQAQIGSLLDQITQLKGQLSRLLEQKNLVSTPTPNYTTPSTGSDIPRPKVCSSITDDMSRGSQSDAVVNLQAFLREEGFFSGDSTGYYGAVTADSVGRFQIEKAIVPNTPHAGGLGNVGPKTRTYIFTMWCTAPSTETHSTSTTSTSKGVIQ